MRKPDETITSRQNALVKLTASLTERKYRSREGLFRFDGQKLFVEALQKGLPLFAVLFRASAAPALLAAAGDPDVPADCRVALLEESDGVVADEEPYVGGEAAPVRLRENVVAEVGDIVPDEEVGGDGAPVLDVLAEANVVGACLERLRDVHLYAAEADDDVLRGACDLRRLSRVLVCESLQ